MNGALAVNCLNGKPIGLRDVLTFENVNPHGAVMVMLRKPGDAPMFACADDSVWCGINTVRVTFENGVPVVSAPVENLRVYILSPDGQQPAGETVLQERGYTLTRI